MGFGWTAIEQAAGRARRSAEWLRGERTPTRFLRSIYVREDERRRDGGGAVKQRGRSAAPLLLSAACAAVLVAGAGPAGAAFPGGVGKIVFDSNRDGNYEIYVMNADG